MMMSARNSTHRIEAAGPEARGQIRAMIRAGRLNPLGIDWRRFLLARDEDDQIVGCVQAKHHRGGARELASLYVQPGSRHLGIGSRLILRVLEREEPPLWLTCRSRLVTFYRQFGFQVVDQPRDMPAYFRIVWRLFRLFRGEDWETAGLAVMRWDGTAARTHPGLPT
jgi:GNAT superfamily N-acetyltransferase